MKRFEFYVLSLENPMGYRRILDDMGQKGWSIACVIPSGGEHGRKYDADIILQREVPKLEAERQ